MIKDIKELEKLLKLCRKQGVTEISFEGTSIKFGDLPRKPGDAESEAEVDPDIDPMTGLTHEQLMFLSARPAGGEQ